MRPGHVRAATLHPMPHAVHRYPAAAVDALACPHCGLPLTSSDDVFVCADGHSFDVAKQGYVALLGARARTDTGDSADMVAARQEFLGAGHYAPIAEALGAGVGPVLELGAGTGYYLSALLDSGAGVGVALDSSKFAARRAAHDSRVVSVVADAWSALPIRAESIATVLSGFRAPGPG